jgi:hypothetical protein
LLQRVWTRVLQLPSNKEDKSEEEERDTVPSLSFMLYSTLRSRGVIRERAPTVAKDKEAPADTQRHEIYAALNHATTQKQPEILPLTIGKVAEDDISDNDGPEVQITTTSIAAATATQSQSNSVAESISRTETSTERPYASILTPSSDGDPELLREAPRYLQAIMDPSDTSFPRLSCPAPTHTRYDYLKATPSSTC